MWTKRRLNFSLIENKFEKLYINGFRSHQAMVNPENETLLMKFAEEKAAIRNLSSKYKSSGDKDKEHDFIPDPFFAAIVNQNNELIVGDTLYKYTKEKGLFFAHLKDSTHLFNFFKNDETNKNTKNKSTRKESISNVDPCEERELYGGVTSVDETISRYVAPIEEEDCGGGYGGGGSTTPAVTVEENISEIINNLPNCQGVKGNFFQTLFGKSYYCKQYWTGTTRLRTEFWSKNWLVYASTGIQVKSQRKILGAWFKNKVSVLYLGINKVLLKYNYPEPKLEYDQISTYGFESNRVPLYMYNQSFEIKNSGTGSNWVSAVVDVTKNTIPFFKFDDVDVLNIFIPNVPVLGDYSLNLSTEDIFSESNIKQLYKMGMDFLKDKYNSKKDFVITIQKTPTEIEVLYFGEQHNHNNANEITRYFYKDVGFLLSMNSASNPGAGNFIDENGVPYTVPKFNTKYSVKPMNDYFRNYTYYNLDFYAMGQRNNVWVGNRMFVEESK
jgi:hypothetical protein